MTQMENTRLEKVEDKMHELMDKQSEASVQQAEMRREIGEILHALKGGDGLSVSKGLVPEFIELKKEVVELKQFKFYLMALWGLSLIVWGLVKDFVVNFLKG